MRDNLEKLKRYSDRMIVGQCFKYNVKREFELACEITSLYVMEFFGACKRVDVRSSADAVTHELIKTKPFRDIHWYLVDIHWNEDNTKLPTHHFSHLSGLNPSKNVSRETKSEQKITP